MYFKIFLLNANREEKLKKMGYSVHLNQEVKSYSSSGKTETYLVPIEYEYEKTIWKVIELLPFFERYFGLMKEPELTFKELWDIYINSKNEDDEIGSISLIMNKYDDKLVDMITKSDEILKTNKNKLKKLIKEWDAKGKDGKNIAVSGPAISHLSPAVAEAILKAYDEVSVLSDEEEGK